MSRGIHQIVVCLIVAGLGLVHSAQRPACKASLDIILLVDSSSSIGPDDFQEEMTWAADVVDQFQLATQDDEGDGAKFAALTYSFNVSEIFRLSNLYSYSQIRQQLTSASYLGESSYTHLALDAVSNRQLFSKVNGGRPQVKDVLLVITDGKPSYGLRALIAANNLKTKGVTIVTTSLKSNTDTTSLIKVASDMDKAFYIRVDNPSKQDFDDLAKQVSDKICEVAADV